MEGLKENSTLSMRSFDVGIRIFGKDGFEKNPRLVGQLLEKAASVGRFADRARKELGDRAPRIHIITNSNMEKMMQAQFRSFGVPLLVTDLGLAKRRADLAQLFAGTNPAGEFSYADMMNMLVQEGRGSNLYISADIIQDKPEAALRQVIAESVLWQELERATDGKMVLIGSAVDGVHDRDLIPRAISGEEHLTLTNIGLVFPDSFLMVPSNTRFPGIVDNGVSGTVEINGKEEPIGGNESFLYAFRKMISEGGCSALLYDPFIPGERSSELMGATAKYTRRKKVFPLYATRAIRQGILRNQLPFNGGVEGLTDSDIDSISEDLIDRYFFFCRVTRGNRTETVLTARQRAKGIRLPNDTK